jgi:hypothetical protein
LSLVQAMRRHTSAVVTPEDVKKYVSGKNPNIRVKDAEDGTLTIESSSFEFVFKPKNVKWHVKIEATDDPSDSDEKVTGEPVKFIAGFLGGGIPGGEHFEKMSAGPDELASYLRHIAARMDSGSIGPRRLSCILRRAAIIPQIDLLRRVIAAVSKTAAGQELSLKEVKKLQDEMEKKGWKVKEGETDYGAPQLHVDISGIYDAYVRVDSLPYDYEMNTLGHTDLTEKGETEDPIAIIRNYAKSDKVNEALERSKIEQGKTELPSGDFPKSKRGIKPDLEGTEKTVPAPGNEKTVRPGKPDIREDKTVAPTKRK